MYGSRNITVINSNFTDTSAEYGIIGLTHINSQFSGDFKIYITDSRFRNCSRAIYSENRAHMTVINSDFFDITATGRGGVIYSSNSVTLTSCTIMNSTAVSGDGGAVYSEGSISVFNSFLINNSAMATNSGGGSLYSSQSVTITNCHIIKLTALRLVMVVLFMAGK